jgi:hypothetical protein
MRYYNSKYITITGFKWDTWNTKWMELPLDNCSSHQWRTQKLAKIRAKATINSNSSIYKKNCMAKQRCYICLLGRRRRRYPSLDAFASLAAPTEAKQPAVSTLRLTCCKTKAYNEVTSSRVLIQHEGPRGIRPIVTGPARLSVLRARFVKAFL